LLASAVGRPEASFGGEDAYGSLFEKVAALFESIARNHAFLEGNKRTAVVAAIHMLNWNGYDLDASQDDLIDLVLGVVAKTIDVSKSAEFFATHAVQIDYPELHENQ